jgi:hypothetical protein
LAFSPSGVPTSEPTSAQSLPATAEDSTNWMPIMMGGLGIFIIVGAAASYYRSMDTDNHFRSNNEVTVARAIAKVACAPNEDDPVRAASNKYIARDTFISYERSFQLSLETETESEPECGDTQRKKSRKDSRRNRSKKSSAYNV